MQILFFDGECVLCNSAAQWIAKHNLSGNIRFASLQGSYAKEKLADEFLNAGSLVFLDGNLFFVRSAAVFRILKYLPAWSWLRILRFIPQRTADLIYNQVAARRFRWFGRREACRVPPPEVRERFIID